MSTPGSFPCILKLLCGTTLEEMKKTHRISTKLTLMVYILASILFFHVCRYKILTLCQTSTFKKIMFIYVCVCMCLREGACMHGAPVEVRGQLTACGSQGLNDRLCNRCPDFATGAVTAEPSLWAQISTF